MEHVIGMGLAAGRGLRFRPLSLKAREYLRAKAAVRLLGRRVLDWIIAILQQQGVEDYIMVTKGKENRYQIKQIVGYGEGLGVRVRYSHVRFDKDNTGSADATLTNIEQFDIRETCFVFPTDSVLDIDLPAMVSAHRKTGAVVTIAASQQPAEVIANRYGLIDRLENGKVRGFIEKPSLKEIYARYGVTGKTPVQLPPLVTNAGFYLMDSMTLREISRHPDVVAMRKHQFDIGGDLLPWLVENGYPVCTYQIGRMGDLGNIPSYLETMIDILHGRFPSINALMPQIYPGSNHIQVDPESLAMTDPISRLTLGEKLERGLVELRPPVRIGKYVRVYPGVVLSECNIDDDCEICENATILRSSIGSGSLIGPYSHIEDTLTGTMVEVQSTADAPISLSRHVALGDEAVVQGGVSLAESVTIYPRLKVPSGILLPGNTDIETAEQMLDYL
ncbi:MAG: sugar phosphate nucleotidyltransferase [Armatimonadota bacterium]